MADMQSFLDFKKAVGVVMAKYPNATDAPLHELKAVDSEIDKYKASHGVELSADAAAGLDDAQRLIRDVIKKKESFN